MMHRSSMVMSLVLAMSQTVYAQQPEAPKGPPPRFIRVVKVDPAKRHVVFDVQVVEQTVFDDPTILEYPGGDRRLTLGSKPSYVYLGEGFRMRMKIAKWSGIGGKKVGTEAAVKRLKPGVMVLLSADGAAVDRAYLRMFREDTLVLVVPEDELPVPYMPHIGGGILTKKVGER